MSAGTGIRHSEFNPLPNTKTHLLQIWIFPNKRELTPTYQQKFFSNEDKRGRLCLILSEDKKDDSLQIMQSAKVYAGLFNGEESARLETELERSYYVHVAKGSVSINGVALKAGDAMKIYETYEDITISNGQECEVLIFDLNKHNR